MKEKFRKVLRVFRVDVLLFGLYAKIALAVTKKLTALKNAVHRFLTRLFPRNGCQDCTVDALSDSTADGATDGAVETTVDTAVDVTVDAVVDVTVIADNP